ncbi:MAG: YitT family protein [Oscillospiraceae bacterium]|nr:YitT family protein [Oscillospiraceae bacterium]
MKKLKRLKQIDFKELKKLRWQNMLLLVAAGCINAVGVTMFLSPVNLYDSGISGTSMLLAQVTPYALSTFLILLNVPLFLFGMKKQGILFTLYSVWAVFIYSTASYVITYVLPVDVSASSPFAGTDLLLCAVFGGLISGVGSGLTIRFGGAIDGVEVLAVIFAKRIGITVGTFVMIYNVILYLIIGCVFSSWMLPLYSIITYSIAIKAVDFIVEGLDKAKSLMIITTREEEICRAISDEFGRGITQIEVKGYYSGEKKCAIYFVVNRFQLAKLKTIIHEIDPRAFITVSEISDVLGTSSKSA